MSHAVSRFLTFTVSISLIPVDRLNVGKLDFLSSGDALEVSELFNLAGVDVEARVLKEAGQGFEPGLFARSAKILQVMPINFETCKGLKNIFRSLNFNQALPPHGSRGPTRDSNM